MDHLKLSGEAILEKEFDVDIKGYNAKQVDVFLDIIYEDYLNMEHVIKHLNEQVSVLTEIKHELEQEVQRLLKNQIISHELNSTDQINTIDILKRLSKLEQEVYNQK